MQLDKSASGYTVKVIELTTELSLLGLIVNLPQAVEEVKKKLDTYKELSQQRMDAQKDAY